MLRSKMQAVMDEVNGVLAERSELVQAIALALLSGSNLFILGEPGQAKSFAVNEFRRRITGARQFERLLSKQCDEEALFGRLDLASLIPGAVPAAVLAGDETYRLLKARLSQAADEFRSDPSDEGAKTRLQERTETLAHYQRSLALLHSGAPTTITAGKIPDCHICFLDEIFKAGDGILNSLLTALNEKRYTNEGVTVDIPVISFFTASNEIPNFRSREEKILAPLYDRLHLKVITQNVQERAARLEVLRRKQRADFGEINAAVTLDELYAMQAEARRIPIPDAVNGLMDDVLCELRRQGVTVSDRKFFDYGRIAQAAAWLAGHSAVQPGDLLLLKNCLWNLPEEVETVSGVLRQLCENPLRARLDGLLSQAKDVRDVFDSAPEDGKPKALVALRAAYAQLYRDWQALDGSAQTDEERRLAADALDALQSMNRAAHEACAFTCTPLEQLAALQAAA